MPASAAQVFGPVTVDPGFTSTGEKTLLTMNTTLPAGGKNVIIVAYFNNSISLATPAYGTFRIKKGATILYETPIANEYLEWITHEPRMFIVVDDTPVGNDTYTFTINIAGAGSATTTVHVQGIVIKADDASFARTTALVSVASGATSSILSLSTTFPANSKVVVLAFTVGNWSTASGGNVLIGAGNIRLKLGTTTVSSNQFSIGAYGLHSGAIFTLHASLPYFTTVTASSQTWSIEVHNNSPQTFSFYAGIVAFTVFDGAFLDTASVALINGSQVTVGNLTTSLSGDVVTIGIGSAENTGTALVTAFYGGDVVLQRDNSTSGQISLGVNWFLGTNTDWNRSGMLALFRLDTNVTNPSYQIKMTARASGINGEAKILAFVLFIGLAIKRSIFESMRTSEGFIFGRRRFNYLTESLNIGEFKVVFRGIKRLVVESVNIVEQLVMSRVWVKIFTENERISEVGRILRGLMRLVVEEIRAFESATRFRGRFRSLSESLGISEAISISRHLAKAVGESVRVLEHAFKSLVISRVISELARISEVFASAKGKSLSVSEGLNLSEAVGRLTGLVRDIIEQIGVSEASVKARSFVKILGERLDLSEFIKAGRVAVRHISESVRIPEVVVHFKGAVRVLGESLRIVEISNVTRSLMRLVGEAIRIEEAITSLRSMFRAMAEGLAILEDKRMTRYVVKVVDAVMRVGEYVVGFGGKAISILEHIRILEFRRVRKIRTYVRRIVSSLRGKSRAR